MDFEDVFEDVSRMSDLDNLEATTTEEVVSRFFFAWVFLLSLDDSEDDEECDDDDDEREEDLDFFLTPLALPLSLSLAFPFPGSGSFSFLSFFAAVTTLLSSLSDEFLFSRVTSLGEVSSSTSLSFVLVIVVSTKFAFTFCPGRGTSPIFIGGNGTDSEDAEETIADPIRVPSLIPTGGGGGGGLESGRGMLHPLSMSTLIFSLLVVDEFDDLEAEFEGGSGGGGQGLPVKVGGGSGGGMGMENSLEADADAADSWGRGGGP